MKAPRKIWPKSNDLTPFNIVLTPLLILWISCGEEGWWGWGVGKLDGNWTVILWSWPRFEFDPEDPLPPLGNRIGTEGWLWLCELKVDPSRLSSSRTPSRLPPDCFRAFRSCLRNVMTGSRASSRWWGCGAAAWNWVMIYKCLSWFVVATPRIKLGINLKSIG